MNRLLNTIYYDPKHPAGFASVRKLYDAVKHKGYTLKQVRQWLSSQDAYTLHRPARRNYQHARIIVSGIDDQWELDLFDMATIAKHNDGVRFGLLVIDVFSKYLWIKPVKSKKPAEVAIAFSQILSEGRKPRVVRSDLGKEFTGRPFEDVLKENHIKHFYAYSNKKAAVAERCIKTIKLKIYKYVTAKQKYRYVDVLPDIVQSYNDAIHSSIGTTPASVKKVNEDDVRDATRRLRRKIRKRKYKFDVGDTVKIFSAHGTFTREYDERWSNEIFKIETRYNESGVPQYRLKDWADEDVTGAFYEEELQKVLVDDTIKYRIDKILRRRTREGKKEVFVKWYGWPDKFNSWLPASEVQ
jgi:hypothetical protein